MKKKKRQIFIIIVFSLATFLYGCGTGEESKEQRQAVEVLEIREESLTEAQTFVGVLEAQKEVKISSLVPGVLKAKKVQVGDWVEEGQVLAIIDQEELLLQKAALEGQVKSLRSQYEKALKGAKDGEIDILEAQVAQAKEGHSQLEKEVQRYKELYQEGAISIQAIEQAESQLKVASHKHQEAYGALKLAKEGASKEDLGIIEGQLNHGEEQLKLLNKKLQDAEVKAPKAGHILDSFFQEGELVSSSHPLFILGDTAYLEADFSLTEEQLGEVELGQKVNLYRVNGFNQEEFSGVVVEKSPKTDPYTRMYLVTVGLEEETEGLLPGVMVKGEFKNEELEAGVYIPLSAIISSNPQSKEVFLYDEGQEKVFKKEIKLGDLVGDKIHVLKGLKEGDLIVTAGQQVIQEGALVRVVGRK